jgi:hypothetical protein
LALQKSSSEQKRCEGVDNTSKNIILCWSIEHFLLWFAFPDLSEEFLYLSEFEIGQKLIELVRNIPRTLRATQKSANENSLQHFLDLVPRNTWVARFQCPRCRQNPPFKITEFDLINGKGATCSFM